MSIVADFSVPADAFCLGDTLEAIPTMTVELGRLTAHSPEYVMPFVWIMDTDQHTFDAAVAEDSTVETAAVTDSFDNSHLYQMAWADVVSDRLQTVLDHEGVLTEGVGSGDEWRLWVRFGSRDHFADFQAHFEEFGTVTLHQLRPPQTPRGITYGVSDKQRATLLAAYDAGYYDVPSELTGAELADRLDVSQQAVSRRLRRGTGSLVENTLDRHRPE